MSHLFTGLSKDLCKFRRTHFKMRLSAVLCRLKIFYTWSQCSGHDILAVMHTLDVGNAIKIKTNDDIEVSLLLYIWITILIIWLVSV